MIMIENDDDFKENWKLYKLMLSSLSPERQSQWTFGRTIPETEEEKKITEMEDDLHQWQKQNR